MKKLSETDADLTTSLKESIQDPINIVTNRFERLKWKDSHVTVHDAASNKV